MPHNVSEVVVSGLGLVSGEQASVAWPWERVRVMRVNVGMVGLLPDPGLWRGRGRACVRFDTLDFSQITQVRLCTHAHTHARTHTHTHTHTHRCWGVAEAGSCVCEV